MPTPLRHDVSFAIHGPISRGDLPGLCERVCRVLSEHHAVVCCDVASVPTDAVTVDALARLQLVAHGYGCRVVLCNASDELLDLVELMGLANVLVECDVRLPRTRAAARSAGTASRRRGRT